MAEARPASDNVPTPTKDKKKISAQQQQQQQQQAAPQGDSDNTMNMSIEECREMHGFIKKKRWNQVKDKKDQNKSRMRYFMFTPDGYFLVYYKTKQEPTSQDDIQGALFLLFLRIEENFDYKGKICMKFIYEIPNKEQQVWLLTFEKRDVLARWAKAIHELKRVVMNLELQQDPEILELKESSHGYSCDDLNYKTHQQLKIELEQRDKQKIDEVKNRNQKVLKGLYLAGLLTSNQLNALLDEEDEGNRYFQCGFMVGEKSGEFGNLIHQKDPYWYLLISEIPLTDDVDVANQRECLQELIEPQLVPLGMETNKLYEFVVYDGLLEGLLDPVRQECYAIKDLDDFERAKLQTSSKAHSLRYEVKFTYNESSSGGSGEIQTTTIQMRGPYLWQCKEWYEKLVKVKEWTNKKEKMEHERAVQRARREEDVKRKQREREEKKKQRIKNTLKRINMEDDDDDDMQHEDEEDEDDDEDDDDQEETKDDEDDDGVGDEFFLELRRNTMRKMQIVYLNILDVEVQENYSSRQKNTNFFKNFGGKVVGGFKFIGNKAMNLARRNQLVVFRRDSICVYPGKTFSRHPEHYIPVVQAFDVQAVQRDEEKLIVMFLPNYRLDRQQKLEHANKLTLKCTSTTERDMLARLIEQLRDDARKMNAPLESLFSNKAPGPVAWLNQKILKMHDKKRFSEDTYDERAIEEYIKVLEDQRKDQKQKDKQNKKKGGAAAAAAGGNNNNGGPTNDQINAAGLASDSDEEGAAQNGENEQRESDAPPITLSSDMSEYKRYYLYQKGVQEGRKVQLDKQQRDVYWEENMQRRRSAEVAQDGCFTRFFKKIAPCCYKRGGAASSASSREGSPDAQNGKKKRKSQGGKKIPKADLNSQDAVIKQPLITEAQENAQL